MRTANMAVAALAALGVVGFVGTASASSHREAPAIAGDPQADNTDLWAWHTGDAATGVLHVVAAYNPLEEPAGGPNFHSFSDDVLYEIHVARGSGSLDDVVTYQVRFKTTPGAKVNPGPLTPVVANDPTPVPPDPIDANGAHLSGVEFFQQISGATQSYTVTRVAAGKSTVLVTASPAPPSIGPATQAVAYGLGAAGSGKPAYEAFALTFAKPFTSSGASGTVWAGPRDDGFYVDLSGIFDLGNLHIVDNAKGAMGFGGPAPVDTVAGYNCHAIAIDIPMQDIPTVDAADKYKDRFGVWASASRRKVKILRNDGTAQWAGPWTQVSRQGLPLVNEAVIGLQDKDKYNRTYPKGDIGNFAPYFLNPVLVRDAETVGLYALLGASADTACPGMKSCKTQRTDIVAAINIGDPAFPLGATGDVIRVDPAIPVGFPNGRPLGPTATKDATGMSENDVTDILLQLIITGGANAAVTDAVSTNDAKYTDTIPYLPTPWRGWDEGHNLYKIKLSRC